LRIVLIVLAVVAFLGISVLVARVLAADSRERSDVADLIRAQARGDAAGMFERLAGCRMRPSCVARVRADVARLRRPGTVKVVRYDPSTTFALGGHSGSGRIVWDTTSVHRPVVQCVSVRRTGDVLSGPGVSLTAISGPLAGQASC
jgi:hypothetical protein